MRRSSNIWAAESEPFAVFASDSMCRDLNGLCTTRRVRDVLLSSPPRSASRPRALDAGTVGRAYREERHCLDAEQERRVAVAAGPLLSKLVWHHTPKHASWLNMAEIEISVLTKQSLDRRIATLEGVQQEIAPWSRKRNRSKATINWTFNRKDARRVFPELYRRKLAG